MAIAIFKVLYEELVMHRFELIASVLKKRIMCSSMFIFKTSSYEERRKDTRLIKLQAGVSGVSTPESPDSGFSPKMHMYQQPMVFLRIVSGVLTDSPVWPESLVWHHQSLRTQHLFRRTTKAPAAPGVTTESGRSLRTLAKVSGLPESVRRLPRPESLALMTRVSGLSYLSMGMFQKKVFIQPMVYVIKQYSSSSLTLKLKKSVSKKSYA